jgi:hypothetical protein
MIDIRTYARNLKWGWVDAVKDAEATGDLTALARVLRSVSPIEPSTRDLLARLCDSRRLVRKRGRQSKPLFAPSELRRPILFPARLRSRRLDTLMQRFRWCGSVRGFAQQADH